MVPVRKIAVIAGTFAVAAAVGFVMQNGDVLASRFTNETPPPTVTSNIVKSVSPRPGPTVVKEIDPETVADLTPVAPVQTSVPAPQPRPTVVTSPEVASAGSDPVRPVASVLPAGLQVPEGADPLPAIPEVGEAALPTVAETTEDEDPVLAEPVPVDTCEIKLDGRVGPAAMVDLVLAAPCNPDARLTVHHQGLMFTALTDDEGRAEFSVPALAPSAVFIAAFADGEGAMTSVDVPAAAEYDRAVLLWSGEAGVGIHALEFGAAYGEEGHVWSGEPRDPSVIEGGDRGFIVSLGDPRADFPLMAEVYTFPSTKGVADGVIEISVEAEVTADNCGREIEAQSIQITPGIPTNALDLVLTVPDCEATGDYLVLKNMFADLTLASE